MRAIKFRIFDKVNKNMIYPADKIYISMFGKVLFERIDDSTVDEAEEGTFDLMQFTGLLDSKGREIFEGDIIRYTAHAGYNLNSFTSAVQWMDDHAAFYYDCGYYDRFFCESDELQGDVLNYMEIIGNVFEHPGLIEKEEE